MDSLMSVTLQRRLSETLGEPLTPAVVFDYPTVEALTDYLATILPELVAEVAEQRPSPTTTTTSRRTSCCNNVREAGLTR